MAFTNQLSDDYDTGFKVFDEVSAALASEHLWTWVVQTWHVKPSVLYNWACWIGIDRLRGLVQETARKRGLKSKGAWLNTVIKNIVTRETSDAATQ